MYRTSSVLLVVLGVLPVMIAPSVGVQLPVAEAVVAEHYPASRLEPAEAADRRMCHKVTATTLEGGPDRIVAGYTDTVEGALLILQRDSLGAFHVVYESPTDLSMMGLSCEIEIVDVDGDALDDIYLRMTAPKGELGWLFRSTPVGLQNWTPMSNVAKSSNLDNAALIDLHHDGTLQIVTSGGSPGEPGGRVTEAPALYRISNGALTLEGRPLFVATFHAEAPPPLRYASFEQVVDGTGPYVLRLTNGIKSGARRASGVTIRVNDAVLEGASALTDGTQFVDVPIPMVLNDRNTIEVTVLGQANAEVVVLIKKE